MITLVYLRRKTGRPGAGLTPGAARLLVAKETGTALEINSYPLCLDLNDLQVRRAKELGVALVISSDLHVIGQLDTLQYGVSVAQRGWLEKGDLLNTLELDALLKRLRAKRKGG